MTVKFRAKPMKETGLIGSLTFTPDTADDLYLLTAMARAMVVGGKIRCDPNGFPPNWIVFEREKSAPKRTKK